jgi:hypothetical protein
VPLQLATSGAVAEWSVLNSQPTLFVQEITMNATLPQAVESNEIDVNETPQAPVELDAVSLGYVGGGCGMVHFG